MKRAWPGSRLAPDGVAAARRRARGGRAAAAAGRTTAAFPKGEVVFHQHDPADSLHLIVKGRFAMEVITPLGEPATIAIRGPGDSFGEMALVGRARAFGDVEALEDGETFCVYRDRVRAPAPEHPDVDQC